MNAARDLKVTVNNRQGTQIRHALQVAEGIATLIQEHPAPRSVKPQMLYVRSHDPDPMMCQDSSGLAACDEDVSWINCISCGDSQACIQPGQFAASMVAHDLSSAQ